MSTNFKPYTYLVGWSSLNKFYYGVQYNKKANPSNLWTTYFTSSKYVKKFRELYGEPDIIQVRKIFQSKEKACSWEFKVIQRLNCVRSEQWLNRSLAGQKFYNDGISCIGHKHTTETKKKISLARTGQLISTETKKKISMSLSGENNPMFGKHHSEETKLKMSIAQTKENHPLFGKCHSEETKLKMSISKKDQQKFECIYCNNFFTKGMLNRWHNEKCKLYNKVIL